MSYAKIFFSINWNTKYLKNGYLEKLNVSGMKTAFIYTLSFYWLKCFQLIETCGMFEMEETLGNMVQQLRIRLICSRSVLDKLVNLILVDIIGGLPNIHIPNSSFLTES